MIFAFIAVNVIFGGLLNLLVCRLFYVRTDRSISFWTFWRGAVNPRWAPWADMAGWPETGGGVPVEIRIMAVTATFCCMTLAILHIIVAAFVWRFLNGSGVGQ